MNIEENAQWKDVEAYLRENGVEYPWAPRQTLKALLERDHLKFRLRGLEAYIAVIENDYPEIHGWVSDFVKRKLNE